MAIGAAKGSAMNKAHAEIHHHNSHPATWVCAGLASLSIAGLALVFIQGHIYTRETELTRERMDYLQSQVVEMRSRTSMAEAKLIAFERRLINQEAAK